MPSAISWETSRGRVARMSANRHPERSDVWMLFTYSITDELGWTYVDERFFSYNFVKRNPTEVQRFLVFCIQQLEDEADGVRRSRR